MRRFEETVALVSGGARGMGASHVRALVDEGAKVVFGDPSSSRRCMPSRTFRSYRDRDPHVISR